MGLRGSLASAALVLAIAFSVLALPHLHAQASWRKAGLYDVARIDYGDTCWYELYAYYPINASVCTPWWDGSYRCIELRKFVGAFLVVPPAKIVVRRGSSEVIHVLDPCIPVSGIAIAPSVFASPFPYSIALYFGSQPPQGLRIDGAVKGIVARIVRGRGWSPIIVTSYVGGDQVVLYGVEMGVEPSRVRHVLSVAMYRGALGAIKFVGREVCSSLPIPVRVVAYLYNGTVLVRDIVEQCVEPPPLTKSIAVLVGYTTVTRVGAVSVSPIKVRVPSARFGIIALPSIVYAVAGQSFELYTYAREVVVNGTLLRPNEPVAIGRCSLLLTHNGSIIGSCLESGRFVLSFSLPGSRARQNVVVFVASLGTSLFSIFWSVAVAAVVLGVLYAGFRWVLRGAENPLLRYVFEMILVVSAMALLTMLPVWNLAMRFGVFSAKGFAYLAYLESRLGEALNALAVSLYLGGGVSGLISNILAAAEALVHTPLASLALAIARAIASAIYASAAASFPIISYVLDYIVDLVSILELIKVFILFGASGVPEVLTGIGIALCVPPHTRRIGRSLIATGISMVASAVATVRVLELVPSIVKIPNPPSVYEILSSPFLATTSVTKVVPVIQGFATAAVLILAVWLCTLVATFIAVSWIGRSLLRSPI